MGQGRRRFTDDFKREAVALLASSGRPLMQIAIGLGIAPSMLRNWRNRGIGQNAGPALHPIPASASRSCLAMQPDMASTADIHKCLADKGLLPAEHVVDAGDTDAALRVGSQRDHGVSWEGQFGQ
jgi:Transposase